MSHRRFRFSLAGMLMLVAIAACLIAAIDNYWPSRQNAIRDLFGGRSGIRIIESPDEVHAFRLNADLKRRAQGAADFPVIAGPVALNQATIEQVSAALLSPGSYDWAGYTCAF